MCFVFVLHIGNLYCKIRDGIGVADKKIKKYSKEIVEQLKNEGYYVSNIDGIWTDDCYDVFLRESDRAKEFPKMKVYVHPNEISGWAPKKEIDKLLVIANNNSCTTNVQCVYVRKVYIMDGDKYLGILKDSEQEIVEWLKRYKKYYKRRIYGAAEKFNDIFGIKRVLVEHLSFKDGIAESYISSLISSYGLG